MKINRRVLIIYDEERAGRLVRFVLSGREWEVVARRVSELSGLPRKKKGSVEVMVLVAMDPDGEQWISAAAGVLRCWKACGTPLVVVGRGEPLGLPARRPVLTHFLGYPFDTKRLVALVQELLDQAEVRLTSSSKGTQHLDRAAKGGGEGQTGNVGR